MGAMGTKVGRAAAVSAVVGLLGVGAMSIAGAQESSTTTTDGSATATATDGSTQDNSSTAATDRENCPDKVAGASSGSSGSGSSGSTSSSVAT